MAILSGCSSSSGGRGASCPFFLEAETSHVFACSHNYETQTKQNRPEQFAGTFNPHSDASPGQVKALLSDANTFNGFSNRDVRERLAGASLLRT